MNDAIVIVACSYRITPEDMLNRLRKLLSEQRADVCGFVVSSKAQEEEDMGFGWTLLPTDNRDFDFSAYLTGAEAVSARKIAAKVVIFVNDTLFTNHAATANFRALWRHVGLVQEIELPAMAGKADLYTTICLKNPWSGLDRYITTFCFMLNRQALDLMRQLRSQAMEEDVTHDHHVDYPAWGARLPEVFRQFLKANLVYQSSSYLWYRLREASYSAAQLSSKARTIYFEHRLSGSIGAVGCLVPTNAGPRWSTYLSIHERWSRVLRMFGL